MIATLLGSKPFVDLPYHLIGWLGWFGLAAIIFLGIRKKLQLASSKKFWILFGVLLASGIVLPLFFGVELQWKATLPLPNITRETSFPALMFFSAIPWMLAAGMLGYWPAVVIGFASGLVTALWNTHNIFTPLETAGLALIVSYAFRQNYRSRPFRWLRSPLGTAVALAFLGVPVFLLTTFFSTNGSLAGRLDYAFTQSWIIMVVSAIQVLVAGFVLDLALVTRSRYWIHHKTFVPSPYETGLQERVFYIALPMVFILLLTLAVADWIVAGKAAQDMLESRLKGTAEIASENIPSLIDTGQGLLLDMVASRIPTESSLAAQDFLKTKLRSVPFFTQFFVFDLTGAPLAGYPENELSDYGLTPEEEAGVTLALNGVLIQSYVISPATGENAAQIAYIAAIPDEYGLAKGVIAARTNLGVNLFSQPALMALDEIKNAGGEGVILDGQNRILFHTNPSLILTTYSGLIPETSSYFEDSSGTGTRRMVYASITEEREWKVLLSLPASYAQDLALQIAVPLLAISILMSLGAYLLLRFMVGSLSKSLITLANQADEISKGGLDQKVEFKGVDEIGRLGAAFEQMRSSLKARLTELDVLLEVSQGIAANFEIGKTSDFLLKACLSYGADSARLILTNGSLFGYEEDMIVYAAGPEADEYIEFDKALFDQMGEERILVIPSKTRIRKIGGIKGASIPSAIVSILLSDEKSEYGLLWIAYTEAHRFYDEEIHFLNTIAGQAVLAISNSSLFMNAEIGKKRLESVLTSTPEPVLVVAESGKLLLANQAARDVIGLIEISEDKDEIEGRVISTEFYGFLREHRETGEKSGEVDIEGKTFNISVSSVIVENVMVGTVCVLRDITEFRELEQMKTDFVATVSHDLRAPMGIVRGYATMLQMVGELNEQQKDYADKIIKDLDAIDQMVDKLLDLGRIESGSVLQFEKVAPMDMFDEVVKLLQPLATQRKVQIMRELTLAQDLTIEVDRTLLQQALYNLLDNAIKFSPLNGQVALRLQVLPETVIFEIQDHGAGIAPLDIAKIFDKFSRTGSKDNTFLKGSGLGLSIVKSIAERHNGRTWAKSTLGKGSTFFLEIPIRHVSSEKKNK